MDNTIKARLSIYGALSGITFIYLILTQNAGISIPLFMLIQFVSIYLIIKNREEVSNKKGILLMIPIFLISLNNFISANYLWMPINFLVVVFLYSAMFLMLSGNLILKKLNFISVLKIKINIFLPMLNFIVPFRWIAERSKNKEKNMILKRILIGVLISIPSVLFLILMLSSADMVFRNNFNFFMEWIYDIIEIFNVFKLIIGTFAGLYLFGHLYTVFYKKENSVDEFAENNLNSFKKVSGDIIVLNILLVSILVIYSIFIVIQFRYLFSSGNLPYGLNYAEYARRGFFELVFLSVLNIGLILLTTYLLQEKIYVEKNKWAVITKLMLIYLCILTGIMLISSFYRMSLYDGAYGFTRLRILVYIFLAFEALGLLATLIYIIKHNFNIFFVYAVIGISFYLTINLVKIDSIIAKRNIDMYFAGQKESLDINYLAGLSIDAAPEIMRLLDDDTDFMIKYQARSYLKGINEYYNNLEYNWQSYNLSVEKTKELLAINKDKIY